MLSFLGLRRRVWEWEERVRVEQLVVCRDGCTCVWSEDGEGEKEISLGGRKG